MRDKAKRDQRLYSQSEFCKNATSSFRLVSIQSLAIVMKFAVKLILLGDHRGPYKLRLFVVYRKEIYIDTERNFVHLGQVLNQATTEIA